MTATMPRGVILVLLCLLVTLFTAKIYFMFSRVRATETGYSVDGSKRSHHHLLVSVKQLVGVNLESGKNMSVRIQTVTDTPIMSDPNEDTSNKTLILFLGYKRGGTTFVGDAFNHHPEVFYVFEPGWFSQAQTMGGDYQQYRRTDSLIIHLRNLVKKMCSCNYSDREMDMFVKFQQSRLLRSRSMAISKTLGCDHEDMSVRTAVCDSLPIVSGHRNWMQCCRDYKIHVLKILRVHVLDIIPLLDGIPGYDVKIVFMVRDPRGIINSRITEGWRSLMNDYDREVFPKRLCYDMLENYESALSLKLPEDKLKIVKYEDIAVNPIREVRDIFKFAGISYHKDVDRFLRKNALGELLDPGGYRPRMVYSVDTYRNSSYATAVAWRSKLPKDFIGQIEEQCGEFLHRLGYKFLVNNNYIKLTNNFEIEPGLM